MLDLRKSVAAAIQSRKLFRSQQRILVAVSGGADSLALLQILRALAIDAKWSLMVAHFNHQLRGRLSAADERFVQRVADRMNLPFHAGRGDVRGFSVAHGVSIEMAARQLRHEFLASTALRLSCSAIALAHHADDQVELFFLRLLRGAGSDGLAGMKWSAPSPVNRNIRLVRPLLEVPKAELERFLREQKISFRMDASNGSRDILRNRVRLELLPQLRRVYQPALERTILRLMELIAGEAAVVAQLATRFLNRPTRAAWSVLPIAVQRRVVQLQLQRLKVVVDFELIESLRKLPQKRVSVGANQFVICGTDGLVRAESAVVFREAELRLDLNLNSKSGGSVSFAGQLIGWRFGRVQSENRLERGAGMELFDAEKVGKAVILRHWRPGDRFQPIGMKTAVKLQDWFTNQKVSASRRRELIVATTGSGEIFWVEGLRIGERFKLMAQTRRVLRWRWHPENPGSPALRGL